MVDPTPDPIDQAYRDAETLLTEQAERSARRARILAAVAQDEPVHPVERQTSAPGFTSRYGWLVAASVMLVSGYLVLRFLPSQQFGSPPAAQTAAVKPPQKNERTAALSPPAPVPDFSEPVPTAPTPNVSSSCTNRHAPGNGLFQQARGFGGPATSRRQDRSLHPKLRQLLLRRRHPQLLRHLRRRQLWWKPRRLRPWLPGSQQPPARRSGTRAEGRRSQADGRARDQPGL